MKKYLSIGLISIFVLVGFLMVANNTKAVTPVTTIFSDNFGTVNSDDTTFDETPAWDEDGNGGDDAEKRDDGSGNDSASPDGGRFAVMLGKGGYICRIINTTGYNNVQLSYYWRGDSDSGSTSDDAKVEIKSASGHNCSDGPGWTELKDHDMRDDSSWTTQSSFTNSGMNNTSFLLRFRASTNDVDEHFRVDGILITGVPSDTTAPTSSITSPNEGASVKGTITVTANATDTESGVAKVEFWHSSVVPGVKIGEDTTSPYSISLDTTTMTDGGHSLWVDVYDNVGNHVNSGVVSITVDNTAPTLAEVLAVTDPTNDSTPDYRLSSTEDVDIVYTGGCGNGVTNDISTGENVIWFGPLTDGTYDSCTITGTDEAGNTSNTLEVSDFTVDTVAPSISTNLPLVTNNTTPTISGTTDDTAALPSQ